MIVVLVLYSYVICNNKINIHDSGLVEILTEIICTKNKQESTKIRFKLI